MKKLIAVIAVALITTLCIVKVNKNYFHESQKIEFREEYVDLGEISSKYDTKYIFQFYNSGNIPLKINKVKSSCGCTDVKWPKHEISPGDSSQIEVIISPDYRGIFTVALKVNYDNRKLYKELRIDGVVEYLSLLE